MRLTGGGFGREAGKGADSIRGWVWAECGKTKWRIRKWEIRRSDHELVPRSRRGLLPGRILEGAGGMTRSRECGGELRCWDAIVKTGGL